MIEFEFINDGVILLLENGKNVEEEVLDYTAYEIYRSVKEKGTRLIPTAYYRFMKNHKTLSEIPFNKEEWDTKIIPVIGKRMDEIYYPFQRDTIFRMIKNIKCLNACSPGLGKTIQALSCLKYFNKAGVTNDLILCPSYLRANWLEEIEKWFPELKDECTIIWKAGKKDLENVFVTVFETPGIKILSYDMFATICDKYKQKMSAKFSTVLLDESHMIKNGMSKRYSKTSGILKRSKQTFLLSGTPAPNRPNELYTQFSLISPSTFYDYKMYAYRYCDGHFDKFNRFDDKGSSKTQELSFLMGKLALRLRREDHLEDLPNIVRQKITVSPKTVSKQFHKKKKLFLDMCSKIDQDEDAKMKLQSMASDMFRDTAAIKVEPVIDYLDNYILDDNLEKTILFCKHQIMMDPVAEFLENRGFNFIKISGATPMKDRMGLIDKFKSDPSCKFALLTIGSCSTGLNIIPIRKMIFLELDWTPSILDQAEARISRIGGAKHLHYIYLACEHSLDTMVFNKLEHKTVLISDVVDNGKRYGDFCFENNKRQKIT
jgi:SWI/SNF-related matrix-associated actin-dependent regulator 1 of chromatin subfamily A